MQLKAVFFLALSASAANAITPVTDTCPSDGVFTAKKLGPCTTASNSGQNKGVIRLQSGSFKTDAERKTCLDMCACVHGVTACEIIVDRSWDGCFAHTQPVAGSATWNQNTHSCYVHTNPDDGVCEGTHARLSGDPWCSSFDRVAFGCHGKGDLILTTSRDETDPLMIQARSIVGWWGGDTWTTSKSVAFQINDQVPPISASVPTDRNAVGCPWTFTVGDVTVSEDNIHNYLNNNVGSQHVSGYHYGKNAVFMFPESKARIDLSVLESTTYGCQVGISICLTPEKHGGGDNIVGHLGTPNGDPTDDWPMRDPNLPPQTIPTEKNQKLTQGTQWGVDNWCVFDVADTLLDKSTFDETSRCDEQITMPPLAEVEACKTACCADPTDLDTCKTGALLDCYVGGGPDDDTCVDQGDILDALTDIPEDTLDTFSTNDTPEDLVLPPPSICVMNDLFLSNVECPDHPVAVFHAGTHNGEAPPENIFYDFKFSDAGDKVGFKVWHDIGQSDALELDVYVEYKRHVTTSSKVGDWHCARFDLECTETDMDPTTPSEINAVCSTGDVNSYTVVTVAYVLKGASDAGATSTGGPVEDCCSADTTSLPVRRYTYIINCGCPTSDSRMLLEGEQADMIKQFMDTM